MPAGVAGDMLLAALLDLGLDPGDLQQAMLGLGVGPLPLRVTTVQPGGIRALRLDVQVPQQADWHCAPGHGRHLSDLERLLTTARFSDQVRSQALAVFSLLGRAEAAVHGVPLDHVHFHEVGALDALVDVVGTCWALERLGVTTISADPFTLGRGWVDCQHGRLPVPVPAVVEILRQTGAPHRRLDQDTGELTTPTGCALVATLAGSFQPPGPGILSRIGYGAGHRQIPGLVNLLRVTLNEPSTPVGPVVELRFSVDDGTGEQLGFLLAEVLRQGALEAYALPAVMKKGRPGHEVVVLGEAAAADRLGDWLLSHSSTIGLRRIWPERRILPRTSTSVLVEGHPVRLKVSIPPSGPARIKPEADDVAALAQALDISFTEAQQRARAAFRPGPETACR